MFLQVTVMIVSELKTRSTNVQIIILSFGAVTKYSNNIKQTITQIAVRREHVLLCLIHQFHSLSHDLHTEHEPLAPYQLLPPENPLL